MQNYNKITLAMLVGLAFSAHGQEAQTEQKEASIQSNIQENELGLEIISVTATKRKTLLMDTPVAISALSDAQLKQNGVNNVKDIANLVPGLDISTATDQSAPVISMRGVRSTNTVSYTHLTLPTTPYV